ncbi:MAG: hypothetical protein KKB59_10465 [Spirochaetes bacterium]|nr:hypothetical protein [Spirochaetota bacterium]
MKDFKTTYGGLVIGDWPNSIPKNASGPSASDGTPFTADLIADLWGWQKRIMTLAGMTPNGAWDDSSASQIVTAIERVIRGPGEFVHSALNPAELALRRLLPMNGQVVLIASYQRACDSVYVGDANNAAAFGFYKTSDSSGVTRSTTGAYMVMPDCRGIFLRGLGVSAIRQAANGNYFTGGSIMANYMIDMMGGHHHNLYSENGGSDGNYYHAPSNSGNALPLLFVGPDVKEAVSDGANGNPRFGYENRPASVSGQICLTY